MGDDWKVMVEGHLNEKIEIEIEIEIAIECESEINSD